LRIGSAVLNEPRVPIRSTLGPGFDEGADGRCYPARSRASVSPSDVQRLTAHATALGAGHREIVGLGPGGFPLDVTDPGAGVRDGFPPHGRRPAMGVDLSWPLNWLVRPRPGGDDVR